MKDGEKKEDKKLKPLIEILENIQKKLQQSDIKNMSEQAKTMDNATQEIDNHNFNTFIENFQKQNTGDPQMGELAKKLRIAYLYINS